MENTDRRTATQRLEDLERVVTMLYQATTQIQQVTKDSLDKQQSMAQDMALVKEAVKLLDRKTNAIVQAATAESGITPDSVRSIVLSMNVEELKGQVEEYLKNGQVTPSDAVTATGFCVCEEYMNGTLANPRVQFRLDSQNKETVDALLGKKAGDTVDFGPDKFSVKILETYEVTPPKAPETAAPEATAQTAPEAQAETPAAPANEVPAESPVEFGLQIHGQADPSPSVVTA